MTIAIDVESQYLRLPEQLIATTTKLSRTPVTLEVHTPSSV